MSDYIPRFAPQPPSKIIKEQNSQKLMQEYLANDGTIEKVGVTPYKEIVLNSNGKKITTFTEARKRRKKHV